MDTVPLYAEIDRLLDLTKRKEGSVLLSRMLAEDGAHFSGLSIVEVEWLRGHIYAAIAESSAPIECLVPAREDLRTSSSPYVLAGIARVLRSACVGPAWLEDIEAAKSRIQYADLYPEFRFDSLPRSCCAERTCFQELEATLSQIRVNGCRDSAALKGEVAEPLIVPIIVPTDAAFFSVALEDQDSERMILDDLIKEKPVVLALFYTRCMNPVKCSLTISRLAHCAEVEPKLGYVGMTYDPEYDTPYRLRVYGTDRNMSFESNTRLVRVAGDWSVVEEALELKTGYGATTVNVHAREVFLMARDRRTWRLPPDWLSDTNAILDFCRDTETL